MYASKIAAAVLALAGSSTAAKVCDTATSLCYNEFVQNGIRFRIAIPDTATNTAAYDIALSIIAPVKVGWAAIAWYGLFLYLRRRVAVGSIAEKEETRTDEMHLMI